MRHSWASVTRVGDRIIRGKMHAHGDITEAWYTHAMKPATVPMTTGDRRSTPVNYMQGDGWSARYYMKAPALSKHQVDVGLHHTCKALVACPAYGQQWDTGQDSTAARVALMWGKLPIARPALCPVPFAKRHLFNANALQDYQAGELQGSECRVRQEPQCTHLCHAHVRLQACWFCTFRRSRTGTCHAPRSL